jgi:hypothetical protein
VKPIGGSEALARRYTRAFLKWRAVLERRGLSLRNLAGGAGRSKTRADADRRHLGERVEGLALYLNGHIGSPISVRSSGFSTNVERVVSNTTRSGHL